MRTDFSILDKTSNMIITYMRLLIFSKKNEVLALQLNKSGLEFMIVTAIRQKHHHASVQNDIKAANCEYVCAYMFLVGQ